jgi:dipeptide/tripeptide permease
MQNSKTLRWVLVILCVVLWLVTHVSKTQMLEPPITIGLAAVSTGVSVLIIYLRHLADLEQDVRDEFHRLSE